MTKASTKGYSVANFRCGYYWLIRSSFVLELRSEFRKSLSKIINIDHIWFDRTTMKNDMNKTMSKTEPIYFVKER